VTRVNRTSPAGRAGLAAKDVILSVDGATVDAAGMRKAIEAKRPGETVLIGYKRGNEKKEVPLVLAKRVDPGFRIKRKPNPTPQEAAVLKGWLGE